MTDDCKGIWHNLKARRAYEKRFGPTMGCPVCREVKQVRCKVCWGTGFSDGKAWGPRNTDEPCDACGGTGKVNAGVQA